MHPTQDSFHALARSSPWRWRALHFRHWDPLSPDGVEAWIVRPVTMRVRAPGGPDEVVPFQHPGRGMIWLGRGPDFKPPPDPAPRWAIDVAPTYRPDGLVAERPADHFVTFDDPMYQSYSWVAMLDPQELSHHVAVADLRSGELYGREVWQATLRAEDGYEARCPDCCDLLVEGVEHEVALDVQTAVVVSLRANGATRDWWLKTEILAVDDEVRLPS